MKSIFVFFLVIIGVRSFAQNDLPHYLNAALNNSTVIKENRHNIDLRKLDRSLNNAQNNLPQISFTANYLFAPYFNNKQLITTSPDSNAIGYDPSVTNGGLYSAQLNITKNLFNGGITDANDYLTGLQISSNENTIATARHSLEKDVTVLYLAAYEAQQIYKVSGLLVDTLTRQLNITRSLMEKGLVKQTDYLLLKVELENQKIAAAQSYNNFKTNLYELNSTCGIFDSSLVELKDTGLKINSSANESAFLTQYSIDSMLVLAQQNVSETKYLPQFNVFANTGINAVELTGIQKRFGMSAGFNFTLPIYDGNQKNINRQISEVSSKIVSMQKDNQRVIIQNKLNESKTQIEFYKNTFDSIARQLKDYDLIIKLSHNELMNGQLSMIEFITILRNYLELRKSEIQNYAGYQQTINQFNYWNW